MHNLVVVDQRRGQVKDQDGQQGNSGDGGEVSSEFVGVGGDHVGVGCKAADGIGGFNGHHLGCRSSGESRAGD